jgi:predicted O-methyltransferase YrrM
VVVLQDELPGLQALDKSRTDWIRQAKQLSMLREGPLRALYQLARISTGTIFEIGPYIGGSTIVLAQALKDCRQEGGKPRRLITVEGGGSYDHPQLATRDILRDLDLNLRKAGVRELVEVVAGWTTDYFVVQKIRNLLDQADPIGMMVIDSNGIIHPEMICWGPYCQVPCFVVIDDYVQNGNVKAPSIQPILDGLVNQGFLQQLGILRAATWFGKLVKPLRLPNTMSPVAEKVWRLHPPFTPLGRVGWMTSLDLDVMPKIIERLTATNPGALVLREDAKLLGPSQGSPAKVMETGHGAFHQWGGPHFSGLLFTTSDNSDPNNNGHTYTLELQ